MAGRSIRFMALASLMLWSLTFTAGSMAGASDATPLASPVASATAGETWPSWVEIGPGNATIVRAVRAETCPAITIDGTVASMNIRAQPTADHPNIVCETFVPFGSRAVSVDGKTMPLPVADPQQIVLLGDTGCRMKEPDSFQACNDPAAWPFAHVAASAASTHPDLVVHVGDYLYRESPCPEGNAGCAGSPAGDTWATWVADFFAPAAPLLDAAPWIVVRGNHEDCSRAGYGWFRYLEPRPMPQSCEPYTESYALMIGPVPAVVLDGASAQDVKATADVTAAFAPILDRTIELAGTGPAWLLTHRPLWSMGTGSDGQPAEWSTATYNENGFPARARVFDVVIAGHVHMAQLFLFTPASQRPPQLVSGGGGTMLDTMATEMFAPGSLGDPDIVQGWRWQAFGFLSIRPVSEGFISCVWLLETTSPASCLAVVQAHAHMAA